MILGVPILKHFRVYCFAKTEDAEAYVTACINYPLLIEFGLLHVGPRLKQKSKDELAEQGHLFENIEGNA